MPDGTQWIDIHSDSDRLSQAISNLRNSTWDSTYIGHKTLEDAGLDCVTVQKNTWTFLAEVGVDFATQTDTSFKADGYVEAEYFGRANTILNVNNTGDMDHKALVHEAQHHAGWGVGVTDPAELLRIENLMRDAEDCQMGVKKEEDEDDPGGGEDPTEGGENCDEKLQWVPPVTIEVFVKPGQTTLHGAVNYNTGNVLPTYHLGTITVSASSKGRWVEVEIAEGYWQTVTVCES
ncbi:MAG: hypothetical protein F4020_06520 [Gammaproteobacteria bacterium]|nr:hypothetical protein [Gammaproteobacteria bacterium]